MRLTAILAPLLLLAACSGTGSSGTPPDDGSSAAPASGATGTAPAPGTTRVDPAGVSQVWVPAGTFTMGTDSETVATLTAAEPPAWVVEALPAEEPAREVTLSDGFWIDETEVTNAAFDAFVTAGGYTDPAYWSEDGRAWLDRRDPAGLPKRCPGDGPDLPRRCITWFEAEAYAAWRGGALPTEAQWEYAARGPESTVYPWGDAWDASRANVVDSTGAIAVGSLPDGASWVGAQDMAGNAMEWVTDWLAPYEDGPVTDPTGPATGEIKVEKGGWWGSNEFVARSAYRHFEDPPTYQDKHIGFRIVTP